MSTKSKLSKIVAFYRFKILLNIEINVFQNIFILIGLGWHSPDSFPSSFRLFGEPTQGQGRNIFTVFSLSNGSVPIPSSSLKNAKTFIQKNICVFVCVFNAWVEMFLHWMLFLNLSIPSKQALLLVISNKIIKGHQNWSLQIAVLIKPLRILKAQEFINIYKNHKKEKDNLLIKKNRKAQ